MGAVNPRRQWLYASLALSTLACDSAPAIDARANEGAGNAASKPDGAAGVAAVGGAVALASARGRSSAVLGASAGRAGGAGVATGGAGSVAAASGGMGGTAAGGGGRAAAGSGGAVGAAGSLASVGIDDSEGYVLTVYHTPVESFHSQAPVAISGCAKKPCTGASTELGSFAADFVQAVKDQGAGRITTGNYAGKYLNWSGSIGYWLDEAPRDARGEALIPWVSAAADPKVPYGTHFTITNCGVDQAEGTPLDRMVCTKIEQASWSINDRFEVGLVGAQFDLYIGEEDHDDFAATSPLLITSAHAQIRLTP